MLGVPQEHQPVEAGLSQAGAISECLVRERRDRPCRLGDTKRVRARGGGEVLYKMGSFLFDEGVLDWGEPR